MDARPLKDVLTDLVGDPSAAADALAGAGHDLPPELVAEAVVSFAGTAPAEVAEHLAPFVTAHSGVPVESELDAPADWFELLATAPETGAELDEGLAAAPDSADGPGLGELDFGAGADAADADLDLDPNPGGDLDDEPVAAGGVDETDLAEPSTDLDQVDPDPTDAGFDDGDADETDLDDLDG
ncbi:hypothetical protein O7635_12790 [Asanoa sp. WMMD1127]|uniref:hypothetical protein n=1 Tax=Asanoa sp. WMMD1127 TaxID=3016107 RepID=UPI002417E130|nr:hypothetical protein [Asanoa sp. WMMD1127]MDG4822727.1 hypothetical protein [Asanoa sp. WMMD1127]